MHHLAFSSGRKQIQKIFQVMWEILVLVWHIKDSCTKDSILQYIQLHLFSNTLLLKKKKSRRGFSYFVHFGLATILNYLKTVCSSSPPSHLPHGLLTLTYQKTFKYWKTIGPNIFYSNRAFISEWIFKLDCNQYELCKLFLINGFFKDLQTELYMPYYNDFRGQSTPCSTPYAIWNLNVAHNTNLSIKLPEVFWSEGGSQIIVCPEASGLIWQAFFLLRFFWRL